MKFSPGKPLEEFMIEKKGKTIHVKFRYPRMSDTEEIMRYINAVTRETEFLRNNKRVTRKEEAKWLRDTINAMKTGKKIYIVAEINGRISGSGSVESMGGAGSHVGILGIALREKYTNMGIGTRLIELLMNEAIKIGIEVIKLSHYENNKRARHVYEKLGFRHAGVIPKARKSRNGKYHGEAIMYRILV